MKFFALFLLLQTSFSFAGLDIKPGLWKIDMTVTDSGGKETNISKQMEAAIAKIPPAQRKQMQEMMKKQGVPAPSADPMKICYTEEMLKEGKVAAGQDQRQKCDSNIVSKTGKKIVSTFKCEDGTKGKVSMEVKSPKSYTNVIDVTSPEGKKSHMKNVGTFVSSDCGSVKPIKI